MSQAHWNNDAFGWTCRCPKVHEPLIAACPRCATKRPPLDQERDDEKAKEAAREG